MSDDEDSEYEYITIVVIPDLPDEPVQNTIGKSKEGANLIDAKSSFKIEDRNEKETKNKNIVGLKRYGLDHGGTLVEHVHYDPKRSYETSLLNDNEQFTCSVCKKKLRLKYKARHMFSHSAEKLFSCSICNKKFKSKGFLDTHRKKIHNLSTLELLPFSCTICDKRFCGNPALRSHIESHTTKKCYTCGICSKKFKTQRNLNAHALDHTGDWPSSENDF